MSEETPKGIWIVTDETTVDEETDGSKWGRSVGADYPDETQKNKTKTRIKAEELKNNMSEFLDVVEETFEKAEKPSAKMQLEELELSVEINGKGQVCLLGTGGEVGSKGAIKLKFKRQDG